MSIGITIQTNDEAFEDTPNRVDEAIYQAKGSGHYRVVLADSP